MVGSVDRSISAICLLARHALSDADIAGRGDQSAHDGGGRAPGSQHPQARGRSCSETR